MLKKKLVNNNEDELTNIWMEMQAFHCNSRNASKHKVIVCTYTQITYTYQIDYMHYKLSYSYNVIMHCGNYTEGQIHVTHA